MRMSTEDVNTTLFCYDCKTCLADLFSEGLFIVQLV